MSGHIKLGRAASFRSQSFNAESNTIDIVFSTGAAVRRIDLWTGAEYDEYLSMEPAAVRLGRLNAGAAPFLDTHDSTALAAVIGSVVPNSARIEDGRGICTVLLSKAPSVADTVTKVKETVIRSVSVGYWVHEVVKTDGDNGIARWDVFDWEPLEISAVPIPADPGSMIRSAPAGAANPQRRTGHAEIRRMAARAGKSEMAEAAIRAGQTENQFFHNLATTLAAEKRARRRAIDAAWAPVLEEELFPTKRDQEANRHMNQTDREFRDYAAGAAMAKRVLGNTTMRAAAAAFATERGRPGSTANDAAADFAAGARMAQAVLRK